MIAEQFPGLSTLPDDAKLQLAGELFADVVGEGEEDSPMLAALLDSRLAEYREHPERLSSWEVVKARILKSAP